MQILFRVNMAISQNCPQTVNGNFSCRSVKPLPTVLGADIKWQTAGQTEDPYKTFQFLVKYAGKDPSAWKWQPSHL